MPSGIRIGLVGDFNSQQKAHQAIPNALAAASGSGAECVWISTDAVGRGESLAELDGIWCAPGMPYRSAEGALGAIRHARMSRTPFLGTSAGFQYALVEFARNVVGLSAADHQKSNPAAAVPLIAPLVSAMGGVHARVRFTGGSILRKAYGGAEAMEEFHCSFGLNPRYRRLLESGSLIVAAVDDQDNVCAVELDGHPFFVASLFRPEMQSLGEAARCSPLVKAFVDACVRRRNSVTKVAS